MMDLRSKKQAVFKKLLAKYQASYSGPVAQRQAVYRYYRIFGEPPFRAFMPATLEFAQAPGSILAELFKLKPEEAVKYLENKGYKITQNWRDMMGEAHRQAFTVAKATKADMLQDIRGMLDKALSEGTSLHDFKKELTPKLEAKGFFGRREITKADGTTEVVNVTPSRLENIFRTNVQSAYNAGRVKQMDATADIFPLRQFLAIKDDSTTDVCSKFNGKVFRADDKIWDKYTPPLHFSCRSTVRTLSERAAAREGVEVSEGLAYEDANDVTHQQGFDYNPALREFTPDTRKYDLDIAAIMEAEIEEENTPPLPKKLTPKEAKAMDRDAMRAMNDLLNDPSETVSGLSWLDTMANAKARVSGVKMGKLNSDEKALLAGYTAEMVDDGGGWLYKVNTELRNQDVSAPSAFTDKVTKAMVNAMRKAPKYMSPEPLTREISVTTQDVGTFLDANYSEGSTGEWKGFSSTTKKKGGAGFGNVRFIIHGHAGIGVDVSPLSAEAAEEEVLLPPGTKFRVRKVRKNGNVAEVEVDLI